ncbi:MAG: hypothetical protein KDB27_08950 [Planctomycetales bacterium]|nr:hypothetical protein [Planctomycetales bacterium]
MKYTQAELEAFLDEALSPSEMSEIEAELRSDQELGIQLRAIHGRRDAGVHSLGEIWRRHRVSCPNREQLGSFLLGVLEDDHADYIRFHVDVVGCRLCSANIADMELRQKEAAESAQTRRTKYFQSSAGYVRKSLD